MHLSRERAQRCGFAVLVSEIRNLVEKIALQSVDTNRTVIQKMEHVLQAIAFHVESTDLIRRRFSVRHRLSASGEEVSVSFEERLTS